MIRIEHANLDDFALKYYKKIKAYIEQKNTMYNMDTINCDLACFLDTDLEELVRARPAKIRNIIKHAPQTFTTDIENLIKLYEVFRDKWAEELLNDLKITVCPYCNREYIFRYVNTKTKDAKILATLDHYYDKSTYPFLAVSFFNLIPACHNCNSKFKHTKNFFNELHIHPYEDSFNDKAIFSYSFLTVDEHNLSCSIVSINRLVLDLMTDDKKAQKTIDTFKLEEIYNQHKDIVFELLQKREIYTDSYIDELLKEYEGSLFNNKEDLLRLITCGYILDEDIGKRPLSKLIKDISKQLEFS